MDESLFQLVTVGLLGVMLLVLLVTLLTLNKLGKKLEEGAAPRDDSEQHRDEDRQAEPAPLRAEVAPHDQVTSTPEPVTQTSAFPAAQATPQPEPAAQPEPEPLAAAQPEPEVERAPARVDDPQPAAVAEAPQQEPQQAQVVTGFEDAPEEQPFEREGRWWFKRGDELLVYDEQSGQWESAPAERIAGGPAPPASPQQGTGWEQSAASPAAGGGAEQAAQPAQEQGSFWKCSSCGAVNGSTATSCRMCFAPKP